MLFCKVARNYIVRFARFQQVEGDCLELRGRAALHHDDVIIVGQMHKFSDKVECFGVDLVVPLGAVAHFHYAHARAVVVGDVSAGLFYNFERKHAGACREIVNSHKILLLICHNRIVFDDYYTIIVKAKPQFVKIFFCSRKRFLTLLGETLANARVLV